MKNKIENYLLNRKFTSIVGLSVSIAFGCGGTQTNGGMSASTTSENKNDTDKPIKYVTQEEVSTGCDNLKDTFSKLSANVKELKKTAEAKDEKGDERTRTTYEEKLQARFSLIPTQLEKSQEALNSMIDLTPNLVDEFNETNTKIKSIYSMCNSIIKEMNGSFSIPESLVKEWEEYKKAESSVEERYKNFDTEYKNFHERFNKCLTLKSSPCSSRLQEIIQNRIKIWNLHFAKSSTGNDNAELDKKKEKLIKNIAELEKDSLSLEDTETKVGELSESITTLVELNKNFKDHISIAEDILRDYKKVLAEWKRIIASSRDN